MTTDRIRRVSLKVVEMPLEKRIKILEAAGLASPEAIARAKAKLKLYGTAKSKSAKRAKRLALKKSTKATGRSGAPQK
jgi:hypothetical protein